jgi:hypothetical protein
MSIPTLVRAETQAETGDLGMEEADLALRGVMEVALVLVDVPEAAAVVAATELTGDRLLYAGLPSRQVSAILFPVIRTLRELWMLSVLSGNSCMYSTPK